MTMPKEVQDVFDLRMGMVQRESGFGRVSVRLTGHNTYTITTEIEDRIVVALEGYLQSPTKCGSK